MSDTPQLNMESDLCAYLQRNNTGSECAVSSKVLEAFFHVKGTEIRRMVNTLRCAGEPICSSSEGYYYAANEKEVWATIAQLSGRITKITLARDGMLARVAG